MHCLPTDDGYTLFGILFCKQEVIWDVILKDSSAVSPKQSNSVPFFKQNDDDINVNTPPPYFLCNLLNSYYFVKKISYFSTLYYVRFDASLTCQIIEV